jgi:ABC-type lipoprotein release transport system permease subunit
MILFILSMIALFLASVISIAVILVLAHIGIYAGTGAMSYAFGGEYLYPVFKWFDMAIALLIMVFLSLASTVMPALKILNLRITDILSKRQKRNK